MKRNSWITGLLGAIFAMVIMGCGTDPGTTPPENNTSIDDINISTCTVINDTGWMTDDTTWGESCYHVKSNVRFDDGAVLTIKPGTVIFFDADTGLYMHSSSVLVAKGTDAYTDKTTGKTTPAKPIVFTGTSKTPGYWKGITFLGSNDSRNLIQYASILYAEIGIETANATNRINIQDVTFQHSKTYGFYLDIDTIIGGWHNVTSTENVTAGYLYDVSCISGLDGTGKYTGNTNDYIEVHQGWLDNEGDHIWRKLSVPIYFTNGGDYGVKISAGSYVTIEAGATFLCGENFELQVFGGAFKSLGTADNPIVFKGKRPTAGFWDGITFSSTNDDRNEIGYTHIEDAGSVNGSGSGGAIWIHDQHDRVYIHHSTIKNTVGDGIHYFHPTDPYPNVNIEEKTMEYIDIGQSDVGHG